MQRVQDQQDGVDLRHKGGDVVVSDAELVAGAQVVVVGTDDHHLGHVGSGGGDAALEHLAGVVLARKDEHPAGLGGRFGEEAAGLPGGDVGDELGLPDALAGAAVGTQQGDLAPRQDIRHQPFGLLAGHIAQAVGLRGLGVVVVVPCHCGFPKGVVVLTLALGAPGTPCIDLRKLRAYGRNGIHEVLVPFLLIVGVVIDVYQQIGVVVQQFHSRGGGKILLERCEKCFAVSRHKE